MSFFSFIGSALAALWRDRHYSVEQFDRLRAKRLSNLISHARERVPFYAERFKGLDPEKFSLSDLPPVSKQEMMAAFDQTVTDRAVTFDEVRRAAEEPGAERARLRGKYVLSITSGTSGQVGYFLNDPNSWQSARGAVFARTLRDRLTPYQISRFSFGRRYRMAFVIAGGGPYITYQLAIDNPAAAALMAKVRQFSVLHPLAENVLELNRFRPHYIHGYPTYIESLAHEKLAGRIGFAPEFISVGSEPFTPVARAALYEAFPDAIISETYGSTECLTLANQCFDGRLHVNTDYTIIEAVDEEDRPVAAGELSHHVLVTNLTNYTQPVIRYRLTDSVVIHDKPCTCGRPLPVIEVHGRTDETIWLRDRNGIYQPHTPIPFEVLFLDVPGLIKYQLVHEWQNYLRIRFVCDPTHDGREAARNVESNFDAYLQRHQLDDVVSMDIEVVPDISRPERGQKLRQIFSKVPAPGRPRRERRRAKRSDSQIMRRPT